MIDIKVKTSGLAFDSNRLVKVYQAEIKKFIQKSCLLLEQEVARGTPVGVTGTLRAGVRSKLISYNHGRVGVEGPGARYAPFAEAGRSRGKMPPVDAIALWLRRTDKGQRYVRAIKAAYRIKSDKQALRQAAFLKARAIGRRGTKGAFMFKEAEKKMKPRILQMAERLAKEIADKINGK